ncbi:MAG: hypothetical protein V4581_08345 [Bacteroidota bacterium]
MKKFALIFLFFPALLLTGCNNDDDTTANASGLEGLWFLYNVSGGFGGQNHDFEMAKFTWEFKPGNVLRVQNNETDDNVPLSEGSYTYSITDVEGVCNESLTASDRSFGCITIQNDTLTLSEAFVDGSVLKFKKAMILGE